MAAAERGSRREVRLGDKRELGTLLLGRARRKANRNGGKQEVAPATAWLPRNCLEKKALTGGSHPSVAAVLAGPN